MFKVFLTLIFMMTSISFARKEEDPSQLRVMILDQNIKKSNFPKGIKFDSRNSKMSFSRSERETQFERLKLTEHANRLNMDELDRDLLYMDLKNNSIKEVISTYPKIPTEALRYAKTNFNR